MQLYLSAEEAAAKLKISLTSVYAYVSRGWLRSQRVPGTKRRLYWRADVEKLARGSEANAVAAEMPHHLVSSTKITLLTASGHYYRGQSARELAKTETLESVASLLWQIEESAVFRDELPRVPEEVLRSRKTGETVWQRTMRMLFAIEQSDPRAFNLSREGYCRSGADALRCVAAACLDLDQLSTAPIHDLICDTLSADERLRDIVRQYLVLAADHELDPTTYSVRAAANTGVTPYAAIAVGLLTSSGRRLVFGKAGIVGRFFDEIFAAADPLEPMMSRLRMGELVPGFYTSPYPDGDPRALRLLELLREAYQGDAEFSRLEVAIETVRDATDGRPSFVIPAMFLERKLGVVTEQTTLLRAARVAGWIAHAIEQYYESDLVRPLANYAGELPLPVAGENYV